MYISFGIGAGKNRYQAVDAGNDPVNGIHGYGNRRDNQQSLQKVIKKFAQAETAASVGVISIHAAKVAYSSCAKNNSSCKI